MEPVGTENDIDDILDALGNVQDSDNVDNNENKELYDQAYVDADDGIMNGLGKLIYYWFQNWGW